MSDSADVGPACQPHILYAYPGSACVPVMQTAMQTAMQTDREKTLAQKSCLGWGHPMLPGAEGLTP